MEDKGDFHLRLKQIGYRPTVDTLCLEGTRLGDKYLIFDLIGGSESCAIYYGIDEAKGV